jgi:hypothetical protein
MKKIYQIVSVIAIATILSSCSVTFPVTASAASVGNKVGTSKTIVLGVWQLNKNYGVAEAAHNGKIKGGVATVDVKVTNFLFFQKRELIVTGE